MMRYYDRDNDDEKWLIIWCDCIILNGWCASVSIMHRLTDSDEIGTLAVAAGTVTQMAQVQNKETKWRSTTAKYKKLIEIVDNETDKWNDDQTANVAQHLLQTNHKVVNDSSLWIFWLTLARDQCHLLLSLSFLLTIKFGQIV